MPEQQDNPDPNVVTMTAAWCVIQMFADGSGAIAVWGPFESESSARGWHMPPSGDNGYPVVSQLYQPAVWRPAGE